MAQIIIEWQNAIDCEQHVTSGNYYVTHCTLNRRGFDSQSLSVNDSYKHHSISMNAIIMAWMSSLLDWSWLVISVIVVNDRWSYLSMIPLSSRCHVCCHHLFPNANTNATWNHNPNPNSNICPEFGICIPELRKIYFMRHTDDGS